MSASSSSVDVKSAGAARSRGKRGRKKAAPRRIEEISRLLSVQYTSENAYHRAAYDAAIRLSQSIVEDFMNKFAVESKKATSRDERINMGVDLIGFLQTLIRAISSEMERATMRLDFGEITDEVYNVDT